MPRPRLPGEIALEPSSRRRSSTGRPAGSAGLHPRPASASACPLRHLMAPVPGLPQPGAGHRVVALPGGIRHPRWPGGVPPQLAQLGTHLAHAQTRVHSPRWCWPGWLSPSPAPRARCLGRHGQDHHRPAPPITIRGWRQRPGQQSVRRARSARRAVIRDLRDVGRPKQSRLRPGGQPDGPYSHTSPATGLNVRFCPGVGVLGLKDRRAQPTEPHRPARIDRCAIGWNFSGLRWCWLLQ